MPKTTVKELQAEVKRLEGLLEDKKAEATFLKTKIDLILKICGV